MEEKKKQHGESLADLGEFGLIRRIEESVSLRNESSIIGIGDYAAVLDPNGKKMVVVIQALH